LKEDDQVEKKAVLEALKEAYAAPYVAMRASGCGRVYVLISGSDRKLMNAVSAAAKALGLIFQRNAYYGAKNALYVGYDNATGRELAKGEAIAEVLKAKGIPCYSEAWGD
jgi:hypothetical protein